MPDDVALSDRERATLLAALRFWQDEMLPNGEEAMRPYFDESPEVPLDQAEVDRLRRRLGRRDDSAPGG